MSFQIRKEAFCKGVKSIRIITYFSYGICIRIYENKKYELWNYETIPLSTVSKAVEYFLKEENPAIKELYVEDNLFKIPEDDVRLNLLNFLTEIEKKKLSYE